mgnify:CR=1 FL=1
MSWLSDMFHLKAIEIISRSLRGAVANTKEGRLDMALGQYVAGMGFSNVGLGITGMSWGSTQTIFLFFSASVIT